MADEQSPGTEGILADQLINALAAKRAELDELTGANAARFAALRQMGGQLDMGELLNLRIYTLAEVLFGDDGSPGMTEFRLRYERKLEEITKQVLGEARKAQIAAAAQVTPEQVQQMARASGLVGRDGKPLR